MYAGSFFNFESPLLPSFATRSLQLFHASCSSFRPHNPALRRLFVYACLQRREAFGLRVNYSASSGIWREYIQCTALLTRSYRFCRPPPAPIPSPSISRNSQISRQRIEKQLHSADVCLLKCFNQCLSMCENRVGLPTQSYVTQTGGKS